MSELDDKVAHLKQDMSLYRRQVDGNKRGDDEVWSSVKPIFSRFKISNDHILVKIFYRA